MADCDCTSGIHDGLCMKGCRAPSVLTRTAEEQEAHERDTYRAWWMASEARMKVEREGRIKAEQERDAERKSREFWHHNAQETDTLLRGCRAELRMVDAEVREVRQEMEMHKDAWVDREAMFEEELAAAKREAREAFKSGMVYGINAGSEVTIGQMLDEVDRRYPAGGRND